VHATRISILLALPAICFDVFQAIDWLHTEDLLSIFSFLCYALRWLLYAFIFGYFYPALRGTTAPTKAIGLLIAVLVAELSQILAMSPPSEDLAIAATIRGGQVIVLALGLGLLWERKLIVAAGVDWRLLRDFRKLGSLAVPVSTVIVAVVTTVATVTANAAVDNIIHPPPTPPASVTPTPSDVKPTGPEPSPSHS
jgi:hypothetical protein